MKTENSFSHIVLPFLAVCAVIFAIFAIVNSKDQPNVEGTSFKGVGNCVVTETKTQVGNQVSRTIVTGRSRSWVMIQQPINATNTVALSLGGTAVVGTGVNLTPATTTSPVNSFTVGYDTPMPYQGAITAISNAGSSTVNVIECK